MEKLARWMAAAGKRDADVARAVRMSRPQISKIRRGLSGASQRNAVKLQLLTGIQWWHFLDRREG